MDAKTPCDPWMKVRCVVRVFQTSGGCAVAAEARPPCGLQKKGLWTLGWRQEGTRRLNVQEVPRKWPGESGGAVREADTKEEENIFAEEDPRKGLVGRRRQSATFPKKKMGSGRVWHLFKSEGSGSIRVRWSVLEVGVEGSILSTSRIRAGLLLNRDSMGVG